jgi:hypothetical protein
VRKVEVLGSFVEAAQDNHWSEEQERIGNQQRVEEAVNL